MQMKPQGEMDQLEKEEMKAVKPKGNKKAPGRSVIGVGKLRKINKKEEMLRRKENMKRASGFAK